MVKLSVWEEFIIGAAVSFLTLLQSKTKNAEALAGIQAALTFLQSLLNGQVSAT